MWVEGWAVAAGHASRWQERRFWAGRRPPCCTCTLLHPAGAAHAARKAPSLAARGAAGASQSKRSALTHSRPTKTAGAAKSGGTSSSSLSKVTLPLDKGRTTAAVGIGPRAASTSRLATALQQQQQQQQLPGL